MIRFLLVCITVIGFLILSIPILIVEWIIGKFNPYKKDISSLHLIQSVFRFILWLTGVEVTVIGEELVPTDEAVLYIGNHRSFFDILLTYTRCPRLTGVPDEKRTARFVCAIAAAFPDGTIKTTEGVIEGRIGYEERGENGFGYDPIFYVPEFGCTTAELSEEQKNAVSHRGKALEKMREILKESVNAE